MKRFTLILSGVLAAQVVLALLLTFGGSNYGAFKPEQPLLAFDKDKIDQIAIDESGANSVTLKKENGKWVVPALAGFPANEDQVKGLLDKMADLKKGWPVATTSDAAERFKVTDKSHMRRIVLKQGDKDVVTLLIGTSPTYKQAHARTAKDDGVYSVAIATYDAGTRGEEWINKSYLNIPQDKIASVSVGDVTIEGKDSKFTLPGLGADDKPKDADIRRIVSAVSDPSFDVIQGKGADALAKLEPADFQVTVKRTEGDPIVYKYKKEAAGGAYLFSVSGQDYVFRVAEASVDALAKAKRETLIEAKAKPEEKKPDEKKPQASGEPAPQSTPGG